MKRKVIAFDLDGTLAESKSMLTDRMDELLGKLLGHYQVCVISGGAFGQFETQFLSNLKVKPAKLKKLHLMPTCGTRYLTYDDNKQSWHTVYSEDLSRSERQAIIDALGEGSKHFGYDKEKVWGEQIEDRGSQITFSALGQQAPIDAKHAWDPNGAKKAKLRDYVAQLIPGYEVRTGGSTSIDITKLGVDKAYGLNKLMDVLEITKQQILFIGDALHEGGNDYPVKAMGVDVVAVKHWQETALLVEGILAVS